MEEARRIFKALLVEVSFGIRLLTELYVPEVVRHVVVGAGYAEKQVWYEDSGQMI